MRKTVKDIAGFRLNIRVEEWQMEFNLSKWEVLHLMRLNVRGKHKVNVKTLNSTYVQRDLEIKSP